MKNLIDPQDLQTVSQYAEKIANVKREEDRRVDRFKDVYEATGDVQLAAAFLRFLQNEDVDASIARASEDDDTVEVIDSIDFSNTLDEKPLSKKELNRNRKKFYKQYYSEVNKNQKFFQALIGRRLCYSFNCLTGKIVWCGQSITQFRINEACAYIKRYNQVIPQCEDPDWKKKCLYERKMLTKKLAMLQYFRY